MSDSASQMAIGHAAPPSGVTRSAIVDSLVGKAGELIGQAALILLVPRALGPANYGTFALALTVVTLGSASLSVGGPTLMSRFVPAAAPDDRDAVARALVLRMSSWRALGVAVVILTALALVALAPADFLLLPTGLVVLALSLDIAATTAFQLGLAFGKTALWSHRFGVQNAVLVAASLGGYALFGIDGALAGIVLSSAVVLVWGTTAVHGRLRRARRGAEIPPGTRRFGVLYAASSVLNMTTHRGGIVAVALLTGSEVETGLTALALGLVLALFYVVAQMFTVQLPGLAAGLGEARGGARAEAQIMRLGARSLAVVVPITLASVLLIDEAFPVLFGHRFAGAEAPAAIALAALPLVPAGAVATQAAALRLRPGARLTASAAGAMAFLVTVLIAVPAFEAAGAAVAFLSGQAAVAVVSCILLPGAPTARFVAASLGGSALVLAAAALGGAL